MITNTYSNAEFPSDLAHVNRFSTAGELTATIAHEINQPLGAILANAETLDDMLRRVCRQAGVPAVGP